MDSLHDTLKVERGRKNEIFHYSWKEDLKISRMAKFCGKMSYGQYSPENFVNFVYICITGGKSYQF